MSIPTPPPYEGDLLTILRHAVNKSSPITREGKVTGYRYPKRESERLRNYIRRQDQAAGERTR